MVDPYYIWHSLLHSCYSSCFFDLIWNIKETGDICSFLFIISNYLPDRDLNPGPISKQAAELTIKLWWLILQISYFLVSFYDLIIFSIIWCQFSQSSQFLSDKQIISFYVFLQASVSPLLYYGKYISRLALIPSGIKPH